MLPGDGLKKFYTGGTVSALLSLQSGKKNTQTKDYDYKTCTFGLSLIFLIIFVTKPVKFSPSITGMDHIAAKVFILDKLKRELSANLTYHGLHHTLDVYDITKELCNIEAVDPKDSILLETAALFHDSGFTINNKEHELLGCQIVRLELPKFGYTDEAIEQICGMIMATKIPQNPQNHLEAILCDADLDYLGRDDFYSIGATLYEELKAYNVLQNEEAWNRLQVSFLEKHTFFTSTSIERRTLKKVAYLTELRELVESYEKK